MKKNMRQYNRFNHRNNKRLTPRQRQMIFRRICLAVSTIVVAVIIAVLVSGFFSQVKAADSYHKYYKSIEVQAGDTLSSYYFEYGAHFKGKDSFIEEVCMINSIDKNNIQAGMHLFIPYYSDQIIQ